MTPAAWWTMLFVCGIVWGGFGVLLARALGSESRKRAKGGDEAAPRD